jgi:hypothetical protein
MNLPGVYTLANLSPTTALTASAQTATVKLDGITAVTLEAAYQYGSGGASASVLVQTSFDGGTTWRDIARFDFTNVPATKHCNLEGLLSKAVTAYAALAAEGVYDGVLGNYLRAVITTVGVNANTTLSVRASVR